jgi:hypothetical protein
LEKWPYLSRKISCRKNQPNSNYFFFWPLDGSGGCVSMYGENWQLSPLSPRENDPTYHGKFLAKNLLNSDCLFFIPLYCSGGCVSMYDEN